MDAETILKQCKSKLPPNGIYKEGDSDYKCLGRFDKDMAYPKVCKECEYFDSELLQSEKETVAGESKNEAHVIWLEDPLYKAFWDSVRFLTGIEKLPECIETPKDLLEFVKVSSANALTGEPVHDREVKKANNLIEAQSACSLQLCLKAIRYMEKESK